MNDDMQKMIEKKAKLLFKDAEMSFSFGDDKIIFRAGGMLNDIIQLMEGIANFVESTGKFANLPNFDVVLSVQGTFYSFEIEMYR